MTSPGFITKHGFGYMTASRWGLPLRAQSAPIAPAMIPGGAAAPLLCMQPTDAKPGPEPTGFGDIKVDGIRCLYADGMLFSREGTPMNCARQALDGLRRLELAYGHRMFFDGEYAEPLGFDATNAAFRRGEGLGVVWLFDAVPFAEWIRDRSTETLAVRRHRLSIFGQQAASPHVGILLPTILSTQRQTREYYARVVGNGGEGIVVKNPGSVYERNPSEEWLRMKQVHTADGRVIDCMHRNGKLRAITVKVEGVDKPVTVATGWSEADAIVLSAADARHQMPMVEIAFNEKAGGDGAPRHARFVRLRMDKEKI